MHLLNFFLPPEFSSVPSPKECNKDKANPMLSCPSVDVRQFPLKNALIFKLVAHLTNLKLEKPLF